MPYDFGVVFSMPLPLVIVFWQVLPNACPRLPLTVYSWVGRACWWCGEIIEIMSCLSFISVNFQLIASYIFPMILYAYIDMLLAYVVAALRVSLRRLWCVQLCQPGVCMCVKSCVQTRSHFCSVLYFNMCLYVCSLVDQFRKLFRKLFSQFL